LSPAGTFLGGGGDCGAGVEPGRSIPKKEQDTALQCDRRKADDLDRIRVRKSEMQMLSPAGTFLGGDCGAGVGPGRGIPNHEQDTVLQCDRRKAGDLEMISE
jgi:hypothetical protein